MLQIIQQLTFQDTFLALHNWIHGPALEKITFSFVVRLRNVEDHEAEFLLDSVSQHRSQRLDVAMRRFIEQLDTNDTKRELRPPTIVTTEDGNSFDALSLFDCGCTDSAINRAFVLKHDIPTKQLPFPQKSYNANGTPNTGGPILEYVSVQLDISGHAEM
jgi:hypothetical protein